MSERFFIARPISSAEVILDGPEAHHLINVMRAKPGASITLFDNSGAEFTGVVDAVLRSEATIRIVERCEIDRELPCSLTVGIALPKGDRQKWLVEKLTELGVTELVPLVTERSVAQPTDKAAERLDRAVVEAAKQCGRNRLMRIAPPQAWSAWLQLAVSPKAQRRLVAHPGGMALAELDLREVVATQFAVGPEGGLTDSEIADAEAAGWQPVSLGSRILHVETAAIALAAACALR